MPARGPRTVIQTNPLPPGRTLLKRSVTVMPADMEQIVGEFPLYDHDKSQEWNLSRWIDYSARRRMALEIADVVDRRLRADEQARAASESSG